MTAKKQEHTSYRELRDELQRIVASMQTEDADIDEALKLYERGIQIVKQLEVYLKTAGITVRDITAKKP